MLQKYETCEIYFWLLQTQKAPLNKSRLWLEQVESEQVSYKTRLSGCLQTKYFSCRVEFIVISSA